jgi:5'-nucleotidase
MTHLLLTNDDGFEADGLICLAEALKEMATVTVVAPAGGCSCCGHSVTTHKPLRHFVHRPGTIVVEGWPADCVRIGLVHLGLKPDWVVSGINHGGNLGVDIWMSGTVAAAREAALLSTPSMAISQYRKADISLDWQTVGQRGKSVVRWVMKQTQSGRGLWNVNLPALPMNQDLSDPVACAPDPSPFHFDYEDAHEGLIYRTNYHARPREQQTDVHYCFSGTPTASWIEVK